MESSDQASVGVFSIGPSSALGHAIALRLLFCKSISELYRILLARLLSLRSSTAAAYRRFGSPLLRLLVLPLNPRYPHVLLGIVLGAAFLLRRSRSVQVKAESSYRRNFWTNVMVSAFTYDEWAHAARMLEKERGRRKDSDLYDEELVRTKLHELRLRRKEGVVQDILFCLRTDLVRNLGNMCNPELHMGRLQVPGLIQEYIDEVRYHLRAVCDSDSEDILPLEEKLAFVRETRHAFGRTALLLSGGASLGAFHVGVVRTLIEHRLLPRVVAGASVGSIMCSVIATRTWSELQSFFGENMPSWQFFDQLGGIFTIVSRLFTRGAVHEIRRLQHMLRELTQNMTFQEAYDTTGRVLGISVCSPRKHEPPRCLNYLTSPHVVIWSAVTASCAFPGLFEAQELMAKDRHGQLVPYHSPVHVALEEHGVGARHWRDGSLESDLPMVQLKELFNVNHFVVSQANPHIAPLLRLKDVVRAYGGDFAAKEGALVLFSVMLLPEDVCLSVTSILLASANALVVRIYKQSPLQMFLQLAHLSQMEVKHRCNQIWELGFPMGGIAKLFAQDWEGDVTIVMPATLAQFAKLIQNPTPSELQKAVNQGRRCTWEKLSAINANCGIELMLDECVSELNRRRRLKRSLERSTLQISGSTNRMSAAKRIPSWNCIARESSWGSLDEDGMLEASIDAAGNPWAGPSTGTLRFSRNPCDGSDSDGENIESVYHHSWTRAGGPLMRTTSAAQIIQELGGEWIFQVSKEELQSHESSDETDIGHAQASPKEPHNSKRGNKIFERDTHKCSCTLHTRKADDSDVDDQERAVDTCTTLKSGIPCSINSATDHYILQEIGSGLAEASLREAIGNASASEGGVAPSNRKPHRRLEHGGFGSFINKDVDSSLVENEQV